MMHCLRRRNNYQWSFLDERQTQSPRPLPPEKQRHYMQRSTREHVRNVTNASFIAKFQNSPYLTRGSSSFGRFLTRLNKEPLLRSPLERPFLEVGTTLLHATSMILISLLHLKACFTAQLTLRLRSRAGRAAPAAEETLLVSCTLRAAEGTPLSV